MTQVDRQGTIKIKRNDRTNSLFLVKQELHRLRRGYRVSLDSKIPANPPFVIQNIFIRLALVHANRHVTKFPARPEVVSTMIIFASYGGH